MSPAYNLNEASAVIDLLDAGAEAILGCEHREGCAVRVPSRGRLLATGDLHDNPIHLRTIVDLARLDASEDHHVVLHEMIHGDKLVNGMDLSYRMLGRVAALVVERPRQVHPLLANHELAQLTGKGVSKGAGNSVELFADALDFAFSDRADDVAEAVARFIRAMPLALLSEGGVLCAHSLPSAALMKHFDPAVFDRALTDDDYLSPHGAAYLMTWGRGHTEEQLDALAEAWDVQLFCLGHQHVDTGLEVRGNRLLVINSDHERARALPLDLAALPTPEEALMYGVPLRAFG
ncbi:MAG: metallophosphoesterase [Planctomycetes bacterium]|nr:metallophosphoesterase [Planctomycetota bacterium]